MRSNRIPRLNIVTWRATVELTRAIARYRAIRPNSSNHVTLTDLFQPSSLHELRQLDLYTNTDTLNTAHQLDADVVATEVAYTMTDTQPSCSGGRGIGSDPEHLQGGHGPTPGGALEGSGQRDSKSRASTMSLK